MLKIDDKNAIEAVNVDGVGDIYSKNIEKIISLKNVVLERLNENYTIIHSSNDCYYVNEDGEVTENTKVFPNNDIFAFKEGEKWGYKDKSGKIIIEPKFATDINEYGFSGIVSDDKWGVVNYKGEIVKQPEIILNTYNLPIFIGEYLLEISDTYHCLEIK